MLGFGLMECTNRNVENSITTLNNKNWIKMGFKVKASIHK
jgi:hypothetical protein